MPRKRRSLFLSTLFSGLAVVLPLLLLVGLARWLAGALRSLMKPLEQVLHGTIGNANAAFLTALACLFVLCLVTGILVNTDLGARALAHFDQLLARALPGYRTVRTTVAQVLRTESMDGTAPARLHGDVALVRPYGADSRVVQTAIVTARHADGSFTVYVPTAPVPTQGFVYHLAPELVQLLPEVGFEAAMRMVLACGVGAAELLPEQLTHHLPGS